MEFTIKSERYDKMKPRFQEIAEYIKTKIKSETPILIRHHNDPDGYTAGYAIEQACIQLMKDQGIRYNFYIRRAACKAPYYEYADVVRDMHTIEQFKERQKKAPLLIILDNGSTPEDTFSLECIKTLGIEVIVIDHHDPVILNDEGNNTFSSGNCKYLKLHLNPYLFGFDSSISAGMLAYEVAVNIANINQPELPAISGIDDRCEGNEVEQYINNTNLDHEQLRILGQVLDYSLFMSKMDIPFTTLRSFIKKPELRDIVMAQLTKSIDAKIAPLLEKVQTIGLKNFNYSTLDLGQFSDKYTYPRSGKVAGIVKDKLAEENPTVLISYTNDNIIVRQSETIISVHDLVEKLQKDFPDANVNGGGHPMAGSIKFFSAYQEEILQKLESYFVEA